MADITAAEDIWVNEDRSEAFPGDHPEARFLLAGVNARVSDDDAEKYGIHKDGSLGGRKKTAPAEDKKAKPAENKGGDSS